MHAEMSTVKTTCVVLWITNWMNLEDISDKWYIGGGNVDDDESIRGNTNKLFIISREE